MSYKPQVTSDYERDSASGSLRDLRREFSYLEQTLLKALMALQAHFQRVQYNNCVTLDLLNVLDSRYAHCGEQEIS